MLSSASQQRRLVSWASLVAGLLLQLVQAMRGNRRELFEPRGLDDLQERVGARRMMSRYQPQQLQVDYPCSPPPKVGGSRDVLRLDGKATYLDLFR
jgi:hypothetical protein